MQFTKMPDDVHRIATERVKWSTKYQEKYGITTAEFKDAPEGTHERIRHVCKRVYRSLELSGYARIDLRLDKAGKIYVLEANPNPQIAQIEDFAESAKRAACRTRSCCSRSSPWAFNGGPSGTGSDDRVSSSTNLVNFRSTDSG
jgi:hypothetical protein